LPSSLKTTEGIVKQIIRHHHRKTAAYLPVPSGRPAAVESRWPTTSGSLFIHFSQRRQRRLIPTASVGLSGNAPGSIPARCFSPACRKEVL
jgi:hypothetical protein